MSTLKDENGMRWQCGEYGWMNKGEDERTNGTLSPPFEPPIQFEPYANSNQFFFSRYSECLSHQPVMVQLDNDLIKGFSGILFLFGNVLVVSSMWALGVTGTYLGDYFGILMKSRVTGFPFNFTNHPMYYGSTMVFFSTALW